MRQIRFQSEGQQTKKTDSPAWREGEDEDTSAGLEQQASRATERKRNPPLHSRTLPLQTKETSSIRKLPFGPTTP